METLDTTRSALKAEMENRTHDLIAHFRAQSFILINNRGGYCILVANTIIFTVLYFKHDCIAYCLVTVTNGLGIVKSQDKMRCQRLSRAPKYLSKVVTWPRLNTF